MFSFHKPKIYRSISGCCICKAKSSSSRFTDSKKYEAEFEKCFRITEKRSGEICNACVLLVKRWKKLPPGTQRDWRHVVDARAGPGTKSLKSVKLNNSTTNNVTAVLSSPQSHKKHQKPKKNKSKIDLTTEGTVEDNSALNQIASFNGSDSSDLEDDDDDDEDLDDDDDDDDDYLSEDFEATGATKRKIRKRNTSKSNKSNVLDRNSSKHASKRNKSLKSTGVSKISSFLDMSFWRKEKICCGVIFKGPDNEVLIYPKLLKPCSCRRSAMKIPPNGNIRGSGSSDSGSVTSVSPIEEDTNSNASSSNNYLI